MPLKKRTVELSDDEDVKPLAKKEKSDRSPSKADKTRAESTSSEGTAKILKNDDGEKYIKLSEYRRVTIRSFKGKTLVDLREFYKDKETGELKPGSKGLSLTPEQWMIIADSSKAIDELIAERS